MFSLEEKTFIVRAFSKNPSPTKVRRDFLRHYNVQKGRKQAHYKLKQFIRVNEEFEKSGSVVKKPKNLPCTKRTAKNLNELVNMMAEGDKLSYGKPHQICPLHRCKAKFVVDAGWCSTPLH